MLQVRKLLESDWDFLPKWVDSYDKKPLIKKLNFRDLMPGAFQVGEYEEKRKGLGGFMVCKDQHPIASVWLGMTNSHCALLTNVISDPDYKDKDKNEAIQLLTNFAMDFSKDLGYKYIYENPSYELIKKL